MFSFKRTTFAGAIAALIVAIFAGCKSSETKPQPPPSAVPSPVEAEKPKPPVATAPPDSGDNMAPDILAWDAVSKVYRAKAGEAEAPFTFNLKNVSSGPVTIYDTSTTCDCTVASLPSKPWIIPSGGTGKIEATIDISGKTGVVTNSIVVFTSKGNRRLRVEADVVE